MFYLQDQSHGKMIMKPETGITTHVFEILFVTQNFLRMNHALDLLKPQKFDMWAIKEIVDPKYPSCWSESNFALKCFSSIQFNSFFVCSISTIQCYVMVCPFYVFLLKVVPSGLILFNVCSKSLPWLLSCVSLNLTSLYY